MCTLLYVVWYNYVPMVMKNTTIWVEPYQVDGLRKLSEKSRVPQSIYYREAIDMVLEKYKHLLKPEPEDDAAG